MTYTRVGPNGPLAADMLKVICDAGERCSCADLNYQWYSSLCEISISHVNAIALRSTAPPALAATPAVGGERERIARIIDEHSVDTVKMHGRQNASSQAVRGSDAAFAKADRIVAAPPVQAAVGGERTYTAAVANLREAWTALAMIRETIETLAPSGSVKASEHLDGPTFMHEADALVAGIMALAPPASPLRGRGSLETLIREYARDLRRNSSGGDNYPLEIMTGVADYLDVLIGRASPPEQPAAAPVREIIEQCAHAAFEAYGSITSDQYALEGPAGLAKRMINAIRAISMDKQPLRYGEPVWPNNDEANDLDKGDDA